MKANRSKTINLAVIGIIAAVALMANTPIRAEAGRHFVFHVDQTYVDTESYCVPVMAHMTGTIVIGFNDEEISIVQPLKTEWTNLETGKTVTTQVAGRGFQTFDGSFSFTGGHVFKTPDGNTVYS